MIRSVDPTVQICANAVEENVQDFDNYFEYPNGKVMLVDSDGTNDPNEKNYKIKSFNMTDNFVYFTSEQQITLEITL